MHMSVIAKRGKGGRMEEHKTVYIKADEGIERGSIEENAVDL